MYDEPLWRSARFAHTQQAWFMHDVGVVAARRFQRQLQRLGDVLGSHGRAQLPGDDVAGIVVQNRRQIQPAPADDLEVGKVGLPELVRSCGLVLERIGGLDDDEGGAGDQIMGLQKPIHRGLRDEVALRVGELHRQFPGAEFRLLQGQVNDLVAHIVGNTVPDPTRAADAVLEAGEAKRTIAIVPSIERRPRNPQLVQRPPGRQMGTFDQPDDLQLFGCGISHSWSPPSPIMLFLSSRFSSDKSATNSFKSRASRRRSLTSPVFA